MKDWPNRSSVVPNCKWLGCFRFVCELSIAHPFGAFLLFGSPMEIAGDGEPHVVELTTGIHPHIRRIMLTNLRAAIVAQEDRIVRRVNFKALATG
jgi:hypothetical protein